MNWQKYSIVVGSIVAASVALYMGAYIYTIRHMSFGFSAPATNKDGGTQWIYEGSDRDSLVLSFTNMDGEAATVNGVWLHHFRDDVEGGGYSFQFSAASGAMERSIKPYHTMVAAYVLRQDGATDKRLFSVSKESSCKLGVRLRNIDDLYHVSFFELPCYEIWPLIHSYATRRRFVADP